MDTPTQPAAADDVEQLVTYITQLATGKKIGVVPDIPFRSSKDILLVTLDDTDLSATEFCELASIAGARLLYVRTTSFDTASDPDLDIGRLVRRAPGREAPAELTAFYREACRFDGRARELELAFIVNGVLHSWSVAALWYNCLLRQAAELPDAELDSGQVRPC